MTGILHWNAAGLLNVYAKNPHNLVKVMYDEENSVTVIPTTWLPTWRAIYNGFEEPV